MRREKGKERGGGKEREREEERRRREMGKLKEQEEKAERERRGTTEQGCLPFWRSLGSREVQPHRRKNSKVSVGRHRNKRVLSSIPEWVREGLAINSSPSS